ncbi:putative translation initiation inhibitor, yjgF family [Halovivax ruber XH-70]|uniref:Putative translation initiation inhibitor, yjgF family n=1 Tax=Halovivax ruber (strain DSM 18193 / JCM 13892 / XH-70) TaxID=797302 RepID=L0IGI9_HALRX|nr:RidA family protein [Halovivax ruber]AGB17102.1 putative translation initiation inhibitor, yjgF family [Halovivax ruber XH-70]
MDRQIVTPPGLAEPHGFNHGFLVDGGKTLFLAGQDASGPDGDIVAPGDLVGQFDRVMANLAAVVEEAGGSSDDIVKLNVYVADRDRYREHLAEVGDIFTDYVEEYPAMALFEVSGFYQDEALIEMEGFAVIDDADDGGPDATAAESSRSP